MSPAIAATLTEEALILRLRSTEHDFVERKSQSDKGGWLQTAVAFANSTPIGWPAILFVGVDNEGNPQQGKERLEDLAKSVSGVLDQAYPAIYRHIVPLHLENGACLAVVIPGSEARPHFAGKSYVRDGPQTKEASESQFDRLIAERQSKVRELLRWKGKTITFETIRGRGSHMGPTRAYSCPTLAECDQFCVAIAGKDFRRSIPLGSVEISFDHERDQLKIEFEE
jgi:hypothetical protein